MSKIELDERGKSWLAIIAKNIARLRGGMSEEQLAKKAGVGRNSLRAIEKGESINLQNFIKIAGSRREPKI